MEKREVIKIIEKCAIKYKNNLANKNLLFVSFSTNKNSIKFKIEFFLILLH